MRNKIEVQTRRLYIDKELHLGELLLLEKEMHHYIRNVLKAKDGEAIRVFNSVQGEFLGIYQAVDRHNSRVHIENQIKAQNVTTSQTYLLFSPLKGDGTKEIVHKCTEIGIDHFIPVIFTRTIVRDVNIEKYRKIAIEATEMSERLSVPTFRKSLLLHELVEWRNSLSNVRFYLADEHASKSDLLSEISDVRAMIVGPEGGITLTEREYILDNLQAKSIKLGQNILKAETANIVASFRLVNDL